MSETIKQNIWNGVANLICAALAVLTLTLTVKLIGSGPAGVWGVANSFLAIASTLGGFGFNLALIREASMAINDLEKIRKEANLALFFAVITGFLCVLVFYFNSNRLLGFINYKDDSADGAIFLLICSVSFLFVQYSMVLKSLLHAKGDFRSSGICDILFSGICALGSLIALSYSRKLMGLGLAILAGSLIQFALYNYFVWRSWAGLFMPKWSKGAFIKLWEFSKWVHLGSILGVIGDTLDKILLAALYGPSVVPAYTLARRFYSQSNTIIASQLYFIFPRISSGGILNKVNERLLNLIVIHGATFLYLVIYLFGPLLVGVISGKEFSNELRYPLSIFCLIGTLQSVSILVYFRKLAEGESLVLTITNALAGPGALIAMYLLGLLWGVKFAISGQLLIIIGLLWLIGLGDKTQFNFSILLSRLSLLRIPLIVSCGLCAIDFNIMNTVGVGLIDFIYKLTFIAFYAFSSIAVFVYLEISTLRESKIFKLLLLRSECWPVLNKFFLTYRS